MNEKSKRKNLLSMIMAGDDVADDVRHVARLLACAHLDRSDVHRPSGDELLEMMMKQWQLQAEELRSVIDVAPELVSTSDLAQTEHLALRYLRGRRHLLDERIEHGWICRINGALRIENVVCDETTTCLLQVERPDDGMRVGDVLADLASFIVDFEELGRSDLAMILVEAYDELCGESHPSSLRDHYVSYRAFGLCKRAAFDFLQNADPAAVDRARRLAAIALDHAMAARSRLVLVGGLPGTGKTTLADALGKERDWAVLSSDLVRDEIAGPASQRDAALWKVLVHAPDGTSAMYCALLRRATYALSLGESVVIDAPWSDSMARDLAADIASRSSADLVELMCVAEPLVVNERIAHRVMGSPGAGETALQASMRMEEEARAWPRAHVIDTTYGIEEAMAHLRVVVDAGGPLERLP